MTAVDTSLRLLQAERNDLAGQVRALDDAIASLTQIRSALTDPPPKEAPVVADVRPPHPAPAKPKSRTGGTGKKRRQFTPDEKRAGAELGHRVGVATAAKQLTVVESVLRGWMKQHPKSAGGGAASEPAPHAVATGDPKGWNDAQKDHAVDLATAIGFGAAGRQLNIPATTIRSWDNTGYGTKLEDGRRVGDPEVGDVEESGPGSDQPVHIQCGEQHQPGECPNTPVTPLAAGPDIPGSLGRCSCGKEIVDADAWARHNQTIPNPAGHRLIRAGEAS